MTHTEPDARQHTTPATPVVWILSAGEDHEGGYILGIYATKELAKGDFLHAASDIPFDLDAAWQDDNGAVRVHGGCDWVALEPHPVICTPQINT